MEKSVILNKYKKFPKVYSLDLIKPPHKTSVVKKMTVTVKIDGVGFYALYNKFGVLIDLYTKGDGNRGVSFFKHREKINNLPLHIFNYTNDLLELRGEVFSIKEGVNTRADVWGFIKSIKGVVKSPIEVVFFETQGTKALETKQYGITLGYKSQTSMSVDVLQDDDFMKLKTDIIKSENWDSKLLKQSDGFVFDLSYIHGGEFKNKVLKHKIAYKYPNIAIGVSRILSIEWLTGDKTGKSTPVAVLEPVLINNCIVKRVNLRNNKFLVDNNIVVGDIVKVELKGLSCPVIFKCGGRKC